MQKNASNAKLTLPSYPNRCLKYSDTLQSFGDPSNSLWIVDIRATGERVAITTTINGHSECAPEVVFLESEQAVMRTRRIMQTGHASTPQQA